jgi:hypothetical protein
MPPVMHQETQSMEDRLAGFREIAYPEALCAEEFIDRPGCHGSQELAFGVGPVIGDPRLEQKRARGHQGNQHMGIDREMLHVLCIFLVICTKLVGIP